MAFIVLPLFVRSPYLLHATVVFLMYAILAMGLNVVVGYAGLLDVGYAAFFACGAYLYAIANVTWGLPFLPAIALGAMFAAIAAVVIGLPTLRVRGDYLALVTLAFGEIVHQVLENWTRVTGGARGIVGIRPPDLVLASASKVWQYYYVVLAIAAGGAWLMQRVSVSRVARFWAALRDDEIAANSCGVDSTKTLLMAFAVGASFAGVAGVIFAAIQRFVSPESFTLDESILVLSMVVLAGSKSLVRVCLSAALLYGIPEALRGFREYRTLLFGMVLVAVALLDSREPEETSRRNILGDRPSTPRSPSPVLPPEILVNQDGPAQELILTHVTKAFEGRRALDDISLSLSLREGIVALIGPNGAGKTTLLNCIACSERIDAGMIRVSPLGEFGRSTPSYAARGGVARTFQRVRMFQSMSVRQNVELGGYRGMLRERVRTSTRHGRASIEVVSAAIGLFGLEPLQHEQVSSLPLALQRRVELARSISMQPRLLLLDEPASGLLESEKADLAELVRLIWNGLRISIVLVEHDMDFVSRLAPEIVVLDAGRILAQGRANDVFGNPLVIDSYLGARPARHVGG